jgi:hypothetical protein
MHCSDRRVGQHGRTACERARNRAFIGAGGTNAILFFEEADALFGKRSAMRDSHDRHPNIEITYRLQRTEAYDGVIILAMNMRASLEAMTQFSRAPE